MEKMTIKDNYFAVRNFLVDNGADSALIAFIDGRIDMTDRKNSNRSNKPTKSAIVTAELAEKVLNLMADGIGYTATDLIKIVGDAEISNQRMTSALKVLMGTGFVRNEKVKGKSLFFKV